MFEVSELNVPWLLLKWGVLGKSNISSLALVTLLSTHKPLFIFLGFFSSPHPWHARPWIMHSVTHLSSVGAVSSTSPHPDCCQSLNHLHRQSQLCLMFRSLISSPLWLFLQLFPQFFSCLLEQTGKKRKRRISVVGIVQELPRKEMKTK